MSLPSLPPPRGIAAWLIERATWSALLLFVLTSIALLLIVQAPQIFLHRDVGYPDSYILYSVEQLRQTGLIYRSLAGPPYVPTVYSPMVYVLLSLPGRLLPFQNAFLGPRIAVLATFALCVAVTASITRALIPARSGWLWGLVLACSIGCMRGWVLQLRGDLPGALFGLLAIRLLLAKPRWAVAAAGLSAGLATQFKFTFVAALVAGMLCLLARRRWRDVVVFLLAGLGTTGGLYLLFQLREPRMLTQILALGPKVVTDFGGTLDLARQVAVEPVLLLALAGLLLVVRRRLSAWALPVVFMLVSFGIGALTAVQAGANVNYFFEGLFAATPLATFAFLQLVAESRGRWTTARLLIPVLVLGYYAYRNAAEAMDSLEPPAPWTQVREENRATEALRGALAGHYVLALVPWVAVLEPDPVITEPYLASYLEAAGRFKATPIVETLRQQQFDAVVTDTSMHGYRGVPIVPADIGAAVAASYAPYCGFGDLVFAVPRARAVPRSLREALDRIGCQTS
jgi:hypothetical protein